MAESPSAAVFWRFAKTSPPPPPTFSFNEVKLFRRCNLCGATPFLPSRSFLKGKYVQCVYFQRGFCRNKALKKNQTKKKPSHFSASFKKSAGRVSPIRRSTKWAVISLSLRVLYDAPLLNSPSLKSCTWAIITPPECIQIGGGDARRT